MDDRSEFWTTDAITYRRVQTSKGPVEYAVVGEGPPILYFHGTGAGADAAVLMERWLLDDGFRLIVPNRPGYYGTPLSCGRSPSDCADLGAELLDQLGIGRVAVIGTSGGGLAACRFAAQHSDRTAALVMQCAMAHPFTSPRWMPPTLRLLYPLFRFHRMCLPILRFGYRREMRKMRRSPDSQTTYLCGKRESEVGTDVATRSLMPLLVESEQRCAVQPAGIENDWANAVGERWLTPGSVRCPVLILHDRSDPVVAFEHVEWILHCVPRAEHCDLRAGGHLIWVGKDAERMRRERAAFLRHHLGLHERSSNTDNLPSC